MGCEEEKQEGSTTLLKLPLLPSKAHNHTHSLSSPIHPSVAASVPFCWEEEPGKPKHQPSSSPSSTSSPSSSSWSPNKSLDLPPRLLHLVEKDAKSITKLSSSPTAVLDGPYSMGRSRRFESSSFRMMVMSGGACYGSFRSDAYGDIEEMEEEEETKSNGPLALVRKRGGYRGRLGFEGFWRRKALKGKAEFSGGSYVFPSSVDRESEYSRNEEEEEEGEEGNGGGYGDGSEAKINAISRTGSFSDMPSASKPHFWATVYEGLKQVVPWKNKKMRRSLAKSQID
ncbi:PREDICTED: uncharacterized protein At4g00950 isoform X2 [Tarenaya hassleriana]|nr:PREDICTED: uncharacterized protein At4g00950 isoform X2 [Tarenaya hassleriana]